MEIYSLETYRGDEKTPETGREIMGFLQLQNKTPTDCKTN